jgi:hypothetical protein
MIASASGKTSTIYENSSHAVMIASAIWKSISHLREMIASAIWKNIIHL